MAATRDYRRDVTHALLWVFFGLLAAVLAPDFAIGAKAYLCLASVAAMVYGLFRMALMPVHGLYRPFMTTAAALAALYAAGFACFYFLPASQSPWLIETTRLVGALALLLLSSSLEIFSRRLHWQRLARGWAVTQAAVGIGYCAPAFLGLFWDFYAPYIQGWSVASALHHELVGFDFHGMRVPGIVGGSRWLVVLALVLLTPVTMMLVNLLRTYVHAASPPPAADNAEQIEWSRR